MSQSDLPLSQLTRPFQRYADSGEINTEVKDPKGTVERARAKLEAEGVNVDVLDGLTADYGTWWFNLRPSNTEPLLRLNVEAQDEESLRLHVDEVLALLKELD
jgi:phosphomannomutase